MLEKLDETAVFFRGSMIRDSKASRRAVRTKLSRARITINSLAF